MRPLSHLQQQLLFNVVSCYGTNSNVSCIVHFSRDDRAEIAQIKELFDTEAWISNFSQSNYNNKWSELIKNSELPFSYVAQSQYLFNNLPELFPAELLHEVTKNRPKF